VRRAVAIQMIIMFLPKEHAGEAATEMRLIRSTEEKGQ
jgi:hypothetical protein